MDILTWQSVAAVVVVVLVLAVLARVRRRPPAAPPRVTIQDAPPAPTTFPVSTTVIARDGDTEVVRQTADLEQRELIRLQELLHEAGQPEPAGWRRWPPQTLAALAFLVASVVVGFLSDDAVVQAGAWGVAAACVGALLPKGG